MNTYITAPAIKTLREQKKLTQAQLADQLSVSHKTISNFLPRVRDIILILVLQSARLVLSENLSKRTSCSVRNELGRRFFLNLCEGFFLYTLERIRYTIQGRPPVL